MRASPFFYGVSSSLRCMYLTVPIPVMFFVAHFCIVPEHKMVFFGPVYDEPWVLSQIQGCVFLNICRKFSPSFSNIVPSHYREWCILYFCFSAGCVVGIILPGDISEASVYAIPCSEWNKMYIGETGRNLFSVEKTNVLATDISNTWILQKSKEGCLKH